MLFETLDPDTGYRGDYLWIPKEYVANTDVIRNSMTFPTVEGVVLAYQETSSHLVLPREYLPIEEYTSLPFPIVDRSYARFPKVRVTCSAEPRCAIQREAHQALLERGSGIVSLACGRGKTIVSIMAWCDIGVPALVVVPTVDLLQQWREAILKFTNLREEDVGILQGAKASWEKPVCVATLHTLAARARDEELPDGFREHFGIIIYDEVHHLGAPTFHACGSIGRGLRWGLSATHEREDGTDHLYKVHIGPVIYENLTQDLPVEAFFYRLPTRLPLDVIPTLRDATGDINLALLHSWLSQLDSRNATIASVIQHAVEQERTILALTSRVEQIDALTEAFGDQASRIHGKLGKERVGALTRTNLVFATTSLAKEGLDRPDLDTIALLLPVTSKGMFRQILGRAQRQMQGKNAPILIVFEDPHIKPCLQMCRKLRSHLASFGYKFHLIDVPQEA